MVEKSRDSKRPVFFPTHCDQCGQETEELTQSVDTPGIRVDASGTLRCQWLCDVCTSTEWE